MNKLCIAAGAAILTLTTAACGSSSGADNDNSEVSVAPQFGMAYLPHIMMTENDLLTESLPDVTAKEVQLSGGGSVVEQLISGAVDIGYMGTAPFLKAVDSDADIRAMSCLEEMPLQLMTMDDSVKSIEDLEASDRVAVPSPSSQQAATLRVAALNELGDQSALDSQMVSLPHPDALNALLSGQDIAAHFTQPPFIGEEKREGAHSILNSHDVFGPHCLIVAVASADFVENNPDVVEGLQEALGSAVQMIKDDPDAAVEAMAATDDETDPKYLREDVTNDETTWTTEIVNLQKMADSLHEAKVLSNEIDVTEYVAEGADVS